MSEPKVKAPNQGEKPLTTRNKILIGGLGALTPIIMNLLVIDLENLLLNLTLVAVIAYIIKVAILFYIGGIVAYLNKDEQKPIKLFQLGIYAPAMIIAFMNTNPLQTSASDIPQEVLNPMPKEQIVVPPKSNNDSNEKVDTDTISAVIQSAPTSNNSTSVYTKAKAMLNEAEKQQIAESSFEEIANAVKAVSNSTPSSNIRAGSPRILAENQVMQTDSMPPALKLKFSTLLDTLIRSFRVSDSAFVEPVIKALAERNPKYYDSLLEDISDRKQQIDQVVLQDPTIHAFEYPNETVGEQFLRGFFGWKSERLWFLVVGKFERKSDAIRHAKVLTKELSEDALQVVSEKPMDTLMIPRVYKPYGEIVPEYCVVMGRHLDLQTAQRLRNRMIRKRLPSLSEDTVELWKLPY